MPVRCASSARTASCKVETMRKIIDTILSRAGRIWLYSTGLAIIGLLVTYGLLSGDAAAAWAALLAPLFGLAIANVPNDKEQ